MTTMNALGQRLYLDVEMWIHRLDSQHVDKGSCERCETVDRMIRP